MSEEKTTPENKTRIKLIAIVVITALSIPLFWYTATLWWWTWYGKFFWWVFAVSVAFCLVCSLGDKTNETVWGYFIGIGVIAAIIGLTFYHHFDLITLAIPLGVPIPFAILGIMISSTKKEAVTWEAPAPTFHGSASWASTIGEHANGNDKQFILGRTVENEEQKLFYQTGHILTCAPSGAGKGIGVVIPNLLEYSGSVFCVDIKGENYAVTADRRRAMGQKIVLIDPFGVTASDSSMVSEDRDAFNLLDWLRAFPDDITADSQMIADALIVNSGESDFWNDSARDLLRGVLAYASTLDAVRGTIGEVRRIITLSKDDLFEVLEDMQKSSIPVVERCANNVISMDEKTRSGVLATAQQQTAFLDEPRIATALSFSTFDLARFKLDSMSFYLVMPPERLAANFRLIRLFISLLITSVTREKSRAPAPALFLFDEFAQLGRMTILEDTLSLIRGYGASYWFIIQDLSQLKAVYTKWQTFLANTTKQFFATSDYDTAKYISDTIGTETAFTFNEHEGIKAERMASASYDPTRPECDPNLPRYDAHNYVGRSLISPDEVMRLRGDETIIFSRAEKPYKITRLNYLEDADFQGKFNPNPMH